MAAVIVILTKGERLFEVHSNMPDATGYQLDIDKPNRDVPDDALIACGLDPALYRNGFYPKY